MACLKSLFSEAERSGLVSANPLRGIRLLNPNNARDRLLSENERSRLFQAAEATRDYIGPLFFTLFFTGMRLGEALALHWPEVQMDLSRLVIRDSKTGEGRTVPLHGDLAEILTGWKTVSRGSEWVFPAENNRANPNSYIYPAWRRLCKTATVEALTPHDLRHNFTSLLQAEGVSDSIIMKLTGHKTHIMLHRYSHSTDSYRRDAISLLPEIGHKGTVVSLPRVRASRVHR